MRTSLMSCGCAALAITGSVSARAQDFQVFRHDLSEIGVTSGDGLGYDQTPIHLPTPIAAQAPVEQSFKEVLYAPLIRQAELRYQLPHRLLQALVWQESRFNAMAISPAGAAGLTQLMPATAQELGVTNRHDPAQNVDGGARYLRQMLDQFGAIHLALAAYNAGPGAVSRARGIPENRETPLYVRSVLARWQAIRTQE